MAPSCLKFIIEKKKLFTTASIFQYLPYSNNLLSWPLPVLVCQTVVCRKVNLESLQGYTKPYIMEKIS